MKDRPGQCRRRTGGVDDKGTFKLVGQLTNFLDIKNGNRRIGREFAVNESGLFIDQGFPFIKVIGILDPANFNAPLLSASDPELLVSTAIDLCRGDDIGLFISVIFNEERIGGGSNGGHAAAGGATVTDDI